jgi:hypothetical protein
MREGVSGPGEDWVGAVADGAAVLAGRWQRGSQVVDEAPLTRLDAGRDWPVAALAATGLAPPGYLTRANGRAPRPSSESASRRRYGALSCRRCAASPDLAHCRCRRCERVMTLEELTLPSRGPTG